MTSPAQTDSSQDLPNRGRIIGPYRTERLLGSGGMGDVFECTDNKGGTKVAIKVLHEARAHDPAYLARFLKEVRSVRNVRHPGIVEVLDSGTSEDGVPYLVMELLEGETLRALLQKRGRLPTWLAGGLILECCDALEAAHASGVIHRDLKPENIFLLPPLDGQIPRPKILDFGIAKMDSATGTDSLRTRTGSLLGTPVYMSPEQCRGTQQVDRRTDVYALGVILYELLAGAPPFQSQGFGELVHMHLNVAPRSLRDRDPRCPASLDEVVQRALAKTPEARYSSASEFAAALASILPRIDDDFALRTTDTFKAFSQVGLPPTVSPSSVGESSISREVEIAGLSDINRNARLIVTLVLGVAVATAGAFGLYRSGKSSQSAAVTSSPASNPPVISASVRIELDSDPQGVEVKDAQGAILGRTPLVFDNPHGDKRVTLQLSRTGFQPVQLSLIPDRDRREWVRMVPDSPTLPRPMATPPRRREPARM